MRRDRNWIATHWNVKAKELQNYNCAVSGVVSSYMFLRELEGEVLENVALSALTARRSDKTAGLNAGT
ncbi:MAG: hypothetical protein DME92_05540 [Verrucomicrobia bacterium]|nr:MAG: hypothetical protein DME92_05540 [Verrucomicrobiota bacterium]